MRGVKKLKINKINLLGSTQSCYSKESKQLPPCLETQGGANSVPKGSSG
jgi:hypothetical protein